MFGCPLRVNYVDPRPIDPVRYALGIRPLRRRRALRKRHLQSVASPLALPAQQRGLALTAHFGCPSYRRRDVRVHRRNPRQAPISKTSGGALMDENPVLVDLREGYRVVTLNRPQRLNAFNEAVHVALAAALAEAEADARCRALLLTG